MPTDVVAIIRIESGLPTLRATNRVSARFLFDDRRVLFSGRFGAAADSMVLPCVALIRSYAEVNVEVSGDSAIAARTGFKSTYIQQASNAASSRSLCALKRPSQKHPVHFSCLLAKRAIGSERAFINQETFDNRSLTTAILSGSFACESTSAVVGSPSCSSILFPGKICSHRRATCRSDQVATTSGLLLKTTCR
jgi:hypothetical protein